MNTAFWEAPRLGIVQFLEPPRPKFKCQLYIFCCVNFGKLMNLSNLQFPHRVYENNSTQLTRLLCQWKRWHLGAHVGSTDTDIGTIQRRIAWPLRKDDTQICEVFRIFLTVGVGGGWRRAKGEKLGQLY